MAIRFTNSDLDIVLIMLSVRSLIENEVPSREEYISDIPRCLVTVHGSEYGEITAVSFKIQAESAS